MASRSIVEHFDVLEDIGPREIARSIDLLPDSLLLQAAEERIRNRVVPAVPSAAHAGNELVRLAETDPVVAAVLRALIRVHDDGLAWLSSPHGHQEGIQHEISGQRWLHDHPMTIRLCRSITTAR